MKPLHALAFGLILIAVGPTDAPPGTFDPFPDPLGWVFALIGLQGLVGTIDQRRVPVLRTLGVVAFLVSVALVVPAAARWIESDPSLGWTADLARFGFFAALSYELSAAALKQKATLAASLFNLSALALLFVLVAPPVAFGGDIEAVGTAGEIAAEAVQVVLVILYFVYGSRPWAGVPEPAEDQEAEEGDGDPAVG
ncbi:hypothetical protein [Nocardioides stalactiti]|uniref:hypothetical protein n=1 Tax=Nocardioides stalactiti TaxID=2755356 RepID=UPI0015FEE64C|nr:hypothetical protein [Nocardioides stalactiti]